MIPFISSGLSNLIRLQIGEIASQKGIITAKPIRTLHWEGREEVRTAQIGEIKERALKKISCVYSGP